MKRQTPTIEYATPKKQKSRVIHAVGIAACVAGVAGALLPLKMVLQLLSYRRGTEVSFFSLNPALELGATIGIVIAFPLTAICAALGWRDQTVRRIVYAAVVITIASIFLNYALCYWIVKARGLIPFED